MDLIVIFFNELIVGFDGFMGLLIGFGHGFGVEFWWWIMVGMGVVVWWWPSMAWALISVEDRDGSLMGIGVA